MWHWMLLADNGAGGGPQGPSSFSMLLPLIVIGIIGYLLLFRPQQKEQAARRKMLENLKKNDRVVTIGGIYGVVANVHRDADEVTLKVDENTNTKIRVTTAAISRVLSAAGESDDSKNT